MDARSPAHFARQVRGLARRALPQCCALCAAPAGADLVCAACTTALPRIAPACPTCALPTATGQTCGRCLARPPPQAAAIAVFAYAFPVDRLLQRLKYGGSLAFAAWAAQALGDAIAARVPLAARPDVLVPMPLSPARQRERGFNQAHEIARETAAVLDLGIEPLLARVRHGLPQAALSLPQRVANVRGAFACRGAIAGRHVALLDDVMTTGATASEAGRTLLAAGAARVCLWVIARTLPRGEA